MRSWKGGMSLSSSVVVCVERRTTGRRAAIGEDPSKGSVAFGGLFALTFVVGGGL